jgi:hypothetical protein
MQDPHNADNVTPLRPAGPTDAPARPRADLDGLLSSALAEAQLIQGAALVAIHTDSPAARASHLDRVQRAYARLDAVMRQLISLHPPTGAA